MPYDKGYLIMLRQQKKQRAKDLRNKVLMRCDFGKCRSYFYGDGINDNCEKHREQKNE